MNYYLLETTIGTLQLVSDGIGLTNIEFPGHHSTIETDDKQLTDSVLGACAKSAKRVFCR